MKCFINYRRLLMGLVFFSLFSFYVNLVRADDKLGYAIVATQAVLDDSEWLNVVESLKERRCDEYNVAVFTWDDTLVTELRKFVPRFACFVTKPEDASAEQLASVWKISRELDDDPYGDVIWGIITGFDAEDALRLTKTQDMTVERALGGTSIALKYFKSGIVFDESKKNHWVVKEEGKEAEDRNDAPDDTTKAIADELNNAQLFVTSGHASERNWSIGYSYKNGFFVAQKGLLLGVPSNDKAFKIEAKGSKIHLASGNCLLGHIDKPFQLGLVIWVGEFKIIILSSLDALLLQKLFLRITKRFSTFLKKTTLLRNQNECLRKIEREWNMIETSSYFMAIQHGVTHSQSKILVGNKNLLARRMKTVRPFGL